MANVAKSGDKKMSIEQIGIFITLIITIAGWLVTGYYQRQILDRQIKYEREKEARQLIIPDRIQQIKNLRDWIEEGLEIVMFRLSQHGYPQYSSSGFEQKFKEWNSKSGKYVAIASMMSRTYLTSDKQIIQYIGQYLQGIMIFMSDDLNNIERATQLTQSLPNMASNILVMIDEILQRCAQEIIRQEK